jgi:DNA-binding NarL/FixJ family response regulator
VVEARKCFQTDRHDLVILDLQLGSENAEHLIQEFIETNEVSRVVVFSGATSEANIRRVLDLGASGYIPKAAHGMLFRHALKIVIDGGVYITPEVFHLGEENAPNVVTLESFAVRHGLTSKQFDVLRLVMTGRNNKAIGEMLSLSPNTVRNHMGFIMKKLGVETRFDLIRLANEQGIRVGYIRRDRQEREEAT